MFRFGLILAVCLIAGAAFGATAEPSDFLLLSDPATSFALLDTTAPPVTTPVAPPAFDEQTAAEVRRQFGDDWQLVSADAPEPPRMLLASHGSGRFGLFRGRLRGRLFGSGRFRIFGRLFGRFGAGDC